MLITTVRLSRDFNNMRSRTFFISACYFGFLSFSHAQDSVLQQLTSASQKVDSLQARQLEQLSITIFQESDKIFREPPISKKWEKLLKEGVTFDALKRLCDGCSKKVDVFLALEKASASGDEASKTARKDPSGYWGIKAQLAIIELVTRTLRQEKSTAKEELVGKLNGLTKYLTKLNQQEMLLRLILGKDTKAYFLDVHPRPTVQEREANHVKSLLSVMKEAKEEMLDAIWTVYIKRLKFPREEAISAMVQPGLSKNEIELLVKQTYGE